MNPRMRNNSFLSPCPPLHFPPSPATAGFGAASVEERGWDALRAPQVYEERAKATKERRPSFVKALRRAGLQFMNQGRCAKLGK